MDDQNQQNTQPNQNMAPQPVSSPQFQPPQQMPPQQYYPSQQSNPGTGFGIASLVLSFFPLLVIVGLVLGIVGLMQSKKAGMSNVWAIVGIILSSLSIIGQVILFVMIFIVGALSLEMQAQICEDYGPGTHYVDGVTYECTGSDLY